MPRSNCACIVHAEWVTEEHEEAAELWIDFIMADRQQKKFVAAGFRPGGELSLASTNSNIKAEYGLNPKTPEAIINPSLIKPEVAAAIDRSWQDVKKPGIATFVVDTSASMSEPMLGPKLEQARSGLIRALDDMYEKNQVGLVTFGKEVKVSVPMAPLRKTA